MSLLRQGKQQTLKFDRIRRVVTWLCGGWPWYKDWSTGTKRNPQCYSSRRRSEKSSLQFLDTRIYFKYGCRLFSTYRKPSKMDIIQDITARNGTKEALAIFSSLLLLCVYGLEFLEELWHDFTAITGGQKRVWLSAFSSCRSVYMAWVPGMMRFNTTSLP